MLFQDWKVLYQAILPGLQNENQKKNFELQPFSQIYGGESPCTQYTANTSPY